MVCMFEQSYHNVMDSRKWSRNNKGKKRFIVFYGSPWLAKKEKFYFIPTRLWGTSPYTLFFYIFLFKLFKTINSFIEHSSQPNNDGAFAFIWRLKNNFSEKLIIFSIRALLYFSKQWHAKFSETIFSSKYNYYLLDRYTISFIISIFLISP